jgi:hypothetical protein
VLFAALLAACRSPLSPKLRSSAGESTSRSVSSSAGSVTLVSPDKKGKLTILDAATKKYLVHLEGSPYAMGYQHGYLLAEEVKFTCSLDFFRAIALDFLGSDATLKSVIDNDTLFTAIMNTLQAVALTQTIYATDDMRQEMKGIAEGAKKRLGELGQSTGSVCYERVMLTNLAFDVILSYVYPIIVNQYLTADQKKAVNAEAVVANMHMCDGFVATPSATATGGTIMTRSFMITEIIGARSVLMEYVPSSGNKFVAVNVPGFVGTPAAMNQYGVSIGMDMVPALKTNAVAPGMGCLLTARYAMQYSSSVPTALAAIKNSVTRGVPWIYIVADSSTGAIAEAAATTGLGWMPDQAKYFAARYVDYGFDATKNPQAGIDQIETRPDLVLTSNHYIDPAVRAASGSYAVKESTARYDYLTGRVLEAINGGLDVARAELLVNYLSPLDTNPYANDIMANPFGDGTSRVGDYYLGKEYVHGIRAVFETGAKRAHVLYGRWTDPWVDYTMPF